MMEAEWRRREGGREEGEGGELTGSGPPSEEAEGREEEERKGREEEDRTRDGGRLSGRREEGRKGREGGEGVRQMMKMA